MTNSYVPIPAPGEALFLLGIIILFVRSILRKRSPNQDKEGWFVQFCRGLGQIVKECRPSSRPHSLKTSPAPSSTQICPKCGRKYQNTAAKFCTADGAQLVNSNG